MVFLAAILKFHQSLMLSSARGEENQIPQYQDRLRYSQIVGTQAQGGIEIEDPALELPIIRLSEVLYILITLLLDCLGFFLQIIAILRVLIFENPKNMRPEVVVNFLVDVVVPCQEEVLDLVGGYFGEEHEEAVVNNSGAILARCH